jgi:RNA 2',3'-cyclic 3'-phosphodiesterase
MNARLFLALWPSDAVRAQLAAWRDGWNWPKGATPVRTHRLHMTLHFIGDVPEERVDEVGEALHVPFPPFDVALGRNALWPHGIAVLEPERAPVELTDLRHALGERLQALALPVDARSYKPHVTLARRAGSAVMVSDGPAISWPIERYALMRSHPDRYEVLRAYPR